jgi:hypothetical protein
VLRALDDRFVPLAGRALLRPVRRGGALRTRLASWAWAQVVRLRAVPGRLRRSTVVLVASTVAVLLSAVGALLAYPGAGPAYPIDPSATASLGPRTGEPVAVYGAAASGRLERLAADSPAAPAYALVDLTRYLTPEQVDALVGGMSMRLAYVQVPDPGLPTEVYPIAVAGPASLAAGLSALAKRSRLAATEEVDVLHLPGSDLPPALVKAIRRRVAALLVEAAAFGPGCRCVFAFVLRGRVAALARLARRPAVRIVDVAPPDVGFAGLAFQWVLPQTRGAFPPGGLPYQP